MRDGLYSMRPKLKRLGSALPAYKVWENGVILDQGQEGSCVGHGWAAWENARPKGFVVQQDHDYAVGWYERAQELDEWPGTDYEGTSVRAGAKVAQERGFLDVYVWAAGRSEIDAWVLSMGPVVIGSKWYYSMDSPDADGFLNVDIGSGVRGGHCFLLLGKGPASNYKFQNSWGESYADEGCFRMTPDNLTRLIAAGGFSACSAEQTQAA
jgi:hypothetical protein